MKQVSCCKIKAGRTEDTAKILRSINSIKVQKVFSVVIYYCLDFKIYFHIIEQEQHDVGSSLVPDEIICRSSIEPVVEGIS